VSEGQTTPDLSTTTRRLVGAFAHGDFDGAATFYAQGAVLDASPLGIGVYDGPEAIRNVLADWLEPYEDYKVEVEEFRDCGNGVTFTVLLYVGQLAGSTASVDVRHAYVAAWAGELVERVTAYADLDEARDAAERLAQERG
jgi:hypothetical protein